MSLVLGLTGSFGSGKSTVAAMLRGMSGAPLIDADALAREALAKGSPLLAAIEATFGPGLLNEAGELRRGELALRAFSNREGARRINALIHPWVARRQAEQLALHAAEPLVILDVPLLYEAGLQTQCDKVAVVSIGEAARFARLRGRGFGEREVMRRLALQWPQSRKAALADFVIENSGSLTATRVQIERMLEQIHEVKPNRP